MNQKSRLNLSLFVKVGLGHIFFLLLLFIVFQLQSCRQKKPQIIKAKLVDLPTPPSISPPDQQSALQNSAQRNTDIPKNNEKKTTAEPPRKSKSSTEPKPRVDKAIAQQPIKYRTPAEIRKSRLTPIKKTSSEKESKPSPRRNFNVRDFQNRLTDKVDTHAAEASYEPDWESEYHELLVNQLYQQWKQPTKTEVANPHLTVRIILEIDKSGQVLVKKIIQPSNNPAMDNSVEGLLRQLIQFPPFPDKINSASITKVIVLKLTD